MPTVREAAGRKLIADPTATGPLRCTPVRLTVTLLIVGGALTVWSGSDRVPADPTQPLLLHGGVRHEALIGSTIRVGTFNIHSGKGGDGKIDLRRTAASLANLDLAGLNEVRGDFLGLRENQAASLGRLLQMAWLFAATERQWWHDHFGNALLTSVALRGWHRIPLPGTQSSKFRCALLANFRHAGRTVQLLVVHLDRVRDREAQLQAVLNLFLSLSEPAILMGDLNTTASDPRLKELLATPGVSDAVGEAMKDQTPGNRIDWIITRGFRCLNAEWRPTAASDHPIVRAELELVEPVTF